MSLEGKSPRKSEAEMIVRMLPSNANPAGNVFGGEILKQIDLVAGLVGQRHARTNTVTASIDRVSFLKPVYVGNALILNGRINYVKKSSMEIEITVEAEDLSTGDKVLTGTAFVTVVALDKEGKPTQVAPLEIETEYDKTKYEEGRKRTEQRAAERKKAN